VKIRPSTRRNNVAEKPDVSGTSEVYVRPFRESGGTWRVSNRGGQTPTWKGDGKEIIYLAPDGTLMAAPVTGAAPFETERPSHCSITVPGHLIPSTTLPGWRRFSFTGSRRRSSRSTSCQLRDVEETP
jgi:hypothetical protein